jgi:uncharacterized membrane protein
MSDLVIVFYWYLILLCFGIGFLPLIMIFLPKLKDKGYGFSRTVSIALFSYIVWLLSSLKVFNFQWLGIWVLLFLTIPWTVIVNKYPRLKTKLLKDFKKLWRIWLIQEVVFLFFLVGWAWIRSFQPSIEGLEKYMDFGFVNSILRTKFMPPKDIWLSGFSINYYYFGHYISAFLTKLSSLPSQYSYNLMMATVMASGAITAFSFAFNFMSVLLKKNSVKLAITAGLLAAFLVNLAGNLHAAIYAFRSSSSYWYPDATRYIGYNPAVEDKTIHEFPIYSYVVADLHGHMINIPIVITTIGFIFYMLHFIFKSKNQTKKILYTVFLSLLLAVSYMSNSWDLPIYFSLFVGNLVVITLIRLKDPSKRVFDIIFYPLITITAWFIFTLPYQLNFTNFAKGIERTWSHSLFYQLLVLWGFFAWFALSYFILHLVRFIKSKNFKKTLNFPVLFPIGLSLFSLILITIPEFFYLKDIYIKSHYRANTMFKLGYQAYIMLSLTSAIVLVYFLSLKAKSSFRLGQTGWLLISAALMAGVSIYPYFAIKGYYGSLKKRVGLDGWNYFKPNKVGDLNAIMWIKQNVADQPVVLEAVGESYTTYSRISANTGLPTVLGWPVHEWLWRGSYDIPGARTAEVQQAYESSSVEELKQFLVKYQVQYIVVGQLEQEKYENLNINNIKAVGKLIFADSGTAIYKIQ